MLHTGLGPDAAASGYMAQVIAVAVQEGGMPIPRGGGAKLADALVAFIREQGGTCETGVQVERCIAGGRARRPTGETLTAATRGDLQRDADAALRRAARRLRQRAERGSATAGPRCRSTSRSRSRRAGSGDERLGETAIVHVTPGLDGVSRAVNEAERGLLPAEATVVVGQPLTMDPSRAPEGKGLLWIQLQELPWRIKGDAAGELDVGDGSWTEELRERYADRIQARLARHIPNLESSILGAHVLSPADLQAANVNLVHGDPYGGSLALDQNFLWRRRRTGHAGCRTSGTSARRRIPARASAAAPARSSRSSSSSRRSPKRLAAKLKR